MDWIRKHRPSPATAIALAALVVALGGAAFAAIPDSSGTIHACYQKKTGDLRVAESSSNCRRNENRLAWNVQGGGRMAAAVGASQDVQDSFGDPPANPDPAPGYSAQITTTRPGRLLITNANANANFACPAGTCRFDAGLYLDGQPLPGTGTHYVLESGGFVGTPVPGAYLTNTVPAGTHTVSLLTKRDSGSARVGGDFAVTGPYDGS